MIWFRKIKLGHKYHAFYKNEYVKLTILTDEDNFMSFAIVYKGKPHIVDDIISQMVKIHHFNYSL